MVSIKILTKKPKNQKLPKLPKLLNSKIYKTGQTRGADDDVIFQNRVNRNSTVLIPYSMWEQASKPPNNDKFENGFIVLIDPEDYFNNPKITTELLSLGLKIGENALVFYQRRSDWIKNNPVEKRWTAAQQRTSPLGGEYVARIAATTAIDDGEKIVHGFNTTNCKGAGIRLYEHATTETIRDCRLQLEAIFWLCRDSIVVAQKNGMNKANAENRSSHTQGQCILEGLLEMDRLKEMRIVNSKGYAICPLCLEELSGQGFFSKVEQAEGRVVHDLTITQLNLFHISELRYGVYNHRPYNLGWGHHHCNVVVKDSGIKETLEWMNGVVQKNIADGHFNP